MSKTRRPCIDCGTPCKGGAYRCRSCAGRERETYRCAVGISNLSSHPDNLQPGGNSTRRRDSRVAEVKDALGYGFDPRFIAADLGIQPASVARMLERAGERQLARRFKVAA